MGPKKNKGGRKKIVVRVFFGALSIFLASFVSAEPPGLGVAPLIELRDAGASRGNARLRCINLEIRGTTTEAKSEIGFFGPSMRSSR